MRATPLAFLVAAVAIACYSAMDAVMKGLVLRFGVYDAMLWRCAAGTVLSWAVHLARRPAWPGPAARRLHLARGLLIMVMALLFFWGLGRVPMAQTVALTFVAPLVALILAAVFLHERIGAVTVLASLAALAGVGVILAGQVRAAPGPQVMLGSAAIIASALCYAVNIVLMRRQALVSGPFEVAAFQNLLVAMLLALAAPALGRVPPPEAWPAVGGAALLGVASAAMLAWAYARAEASYLAATEYTAFVWACLLGFLVYGERVSGYTVAGAGLIVGACLVAALRRPPPPLAAAEGLA